MKTQDQSLYNSLACLVLLGKELKSTLEDLALALQKSEQILIAHNLKTSTRSKNENRNQIKNHRHASRCQQRHHERPSRRNPAKKSNPNPSGHPLRLLPAPEMSKPTTHGGPRKGAGRKTGSKNKNAKGRTAVTRSVSMQPESWQKLDRDRGDQSRGKYIESKL